MLSTFSRSVPSKVYEAWIFLICLHHIAFDRLKSHTLLPCPGTQSINIPLKFYCVFFILNFTITNTVISKKSYFRLNINIMVQQSEIQILHQSFKYLVHCNFYLINNFMRNIHSVKSMHYESSEITFRAYSKLRGWCLQDTADLEQCGQMAFLLL